MSLHHTQYEDEPALLYETPALRLTILPHIGGKVISLVERATGREILWRQHSRRVRRPVIGDLYAHYDISGWDECFPSIGPCIHPDALWKENAIADHGELWTASWIAEQDGDDLVMRAEGVNFPYTFERRFQPTEHGLHVLYSVTNHGEWPFRCFWSIHPFLTVTPTTRILLPEGVSVYVEDSMNARLGGPGSRHPWPITQDSSGRSIDLSVMGSREQRTIEKLFVHGLPAGWVAAFDEATEDFVAYIFDHQTLPFVGMAINRGAWPAEDPGFTLILEPCSGWPDLLTDAIDHGACITLPPHVTSHWHVDLHIGRGMSALQDALGHTS